MPINNVVNRIAVLVENLNIYIFGYIFRDIFRDKLRQVLKAEYTPLGDYSNSSLSSPHVCLGGILYIHLVCAAERERLEAEASDKELEAAK